MTKKHDLQLSLKKIRIITFMDNNKNDDVNFVFLSAAIIHLRGLVLSINKEFNHKSVASL